MHGQSTLATINLFLVWKAFYNFQITYFQHGYFTYLSKLFPSLNEKIYKNNF